MPALDEWCEEQLKSLEEKGLRRELREVERHSGVMVRVEGKDYISFSCNDYFGMSQHPDVVQAGCDAAKRYGAGAGASRLVTGNHPGYTALEAALAKAKGTEAALVFGSGYLANLGTISALMGREDLIIADKYCHACMLDGAKLSDAKLLRFAHNDMEELERLLTTHRGKYRHCLIMGETVYSMDGDRAPVTQLSALAKQHDAFTLLDDAHGFGLSSPEPVQVDIVVGTLSKGVASYGGYVVASQQVINAIKNNGRSFIFTTGLSPSDINSSLKSIELIYSKNNTEQLLSNISYLSEALNLPQHDTSIFPYPVGGVKEALALQEALKMEGLWVQAMRPPTVPEGTARLRIALSALHTKAQLDQLIEALRKYG